MTLNPPLIICSVCFLIKIINRLGVCVWGRGGGGGSTIFTRDTLSLDLMPTTILDSAAICQTAGDEVNLAKKTPAPQGK